MFWGLLAPILCLVMFELCFGLVLVSYMREQRRNSDIFAQASHSRLSESCRNSSLVLVRASRSSDQFWSWATRPLAQARIARPSEVAMKQVTSCVQILVQARDCVWANEGLAQARRSRLSESSWWAIVSHSLRRGDSVWARHMYSLGRRPMA